jgi:hypothetical protein
MRIGQRLAGVFWLANNLTGYWIDREMRIGQLLAGVGRLAKKPTG